MSCINCGGDHDAVECPELDDVDVWGDGDGSGDSGMLVSPSVRRVVDEQLGKVLYVAKDEDGDVQALAVDELPERDGGGIGDMIQTLEDLKAGEDAATVSRIDDRIAALRSLRGSLGGDAGGS